MRAILSSPQRKPATVDDGSGTYKTYRTNYFGQIDAKYIRAIFRIYKGRAEIFAALMALVDTRNEPHVDIDEAVWAQEAGVDQRTMCAALKQVKDDGFINHHRQGKRHIRIQRPNQDALYAIKRRHEKRTVVQPIRGGANVGKPPVEEVGEISQGEPVGNPAVNTNVNPEPGAQKLSALSAPSPSLPASLPAKLECPACHTTFQAKLVQIKGLWSNTPVESAERIYKDTATTKSGKNAHTFVANNGVTRPIRNSSSGLVLKGFDAIPSWKAFWEGYQKFRGTYPDLAENWWKKNVKNQEVADRILAGLAKFAVCDEWTRGVVPHAIKWLKEGRYELDPRPAKGKVDKLAKFREVIEGKRELGDLS